MAEIEARQFMFPRRKKYPKRIIAVQVFLRKKSIRLLSFMKLAENLLFIRFPFRSAAVRKLMAAT